MKSEDLSDWFSLVSCFEVKEHTSWNVHSVADLAPAVWKPETFTDSSSLRFVIALKDSNQLVGTAGFQNVSGPHKSAEVGYELSPSVWGRGIAKAVCRTLVDWAHDHVGCVRVQGVVLPSNARSIQVLERCGFQREGLLRSYRIVRGNPADFWMYSHIKESMK